VHKSGIEKTQKVREDQDISPGIPRTRQAWIFRVFWTYWSIQGECFLTQRPWEFAEIKEA
jgi:hypothetical protein